MALLARVAQLIPEELLALGIVGSGGLISILGLRRAAVLLLLLQYTGLILLLHQQPSAAVAKAVVGVLVGVILLPPSAGSVRGSAAMNPLFRGLGLLAVGVSVIGLLHRYPLLQLPSSQAWISYGLVGAGVWLLFLARDPVLVAIGLLTVLNGFDVLHTTLEPGLLVAALSGVVQILLALIGAYLSAARWAREATESR